MPNYYEIVAVESDFVNSGRVFNVLTGSGTYVCDTINTSTGSAWSKLVAINGSSVLTAESLFGSDLTANNLTYDSGSAVTILQGDYIDGVFTTVKITSGIVLAYRG